MLDSETTDLGAATDKYFVASWSHYFIIGCAVVSIVWGIVNVIMVSRRFSTHVRSDTETQ